MHSVARAAIYVHAWYGFIMCQLMKNIYLIKISYTMFWLFFSKNAILWRLWSSSIYCEEFDSVETVLLNDCRLLTYIIHKTIAE